MHIKNKAPLKCEVFCFNNAKIRDRYANGGARNREKNKEEKLLKLHEIKPADINCGCAGKNRRSLFRR